MDKKTLFYSYSEYLSKKYSARAFRVSVDGGFSCPNRKERESPGCIYCDAHGARATYLDRSTEIKDQIQRGTAFLKKRYRAEIFLLYLQAFTGTYGDPELLKDIWDYALSLEDFRELIVSTRPDCIDPIKADLLASYIKDDFDVWVELGLQSSNDRTLEKINRGHSVHDFEKSFELLRLRGIKIAVHLIFGLPDENYEDMMESVKFVSAMKPDGIKFHNLHVAKGTELEKQFMAGDFSVPCLKRHINYLAGAIELLPPETVVMRLTCDTPHARRLAPRNDLSKSQVLNFLRKLLEERESYQGKFYKD
ncbi:MAG: TIGR01212 family radical SAM protein [Spirochaetia bacterium]|nr:TIGR01212 family radical SAM protein [Spirochaetia bacterium]